MEHSTVIKQFSDVSSQYGAPMGRRESWDEPTGPLTVFRVRPVDGDYDDGGAYWGGLTDRPLYCARGEGKEFRIELFVRAPDRETAMARLREGYTGIEFAEDESADLYAMTEAYIETALWSGLDDETPLDQDHDEDDIAPETRETMERDCREFYQQARPIIERCLAKWESGDWAPGFRGDLIERLGHDFSLTRNGHGAGFWDGDWPDDEGEELSKIARGFGEFTLYVGDDGLIHGD
jgi:hypothetical protein